MTDKLEATNPSRSVAVALGVLAVASVAVVAQTFTSLGSVNQVQVVRKADLKLASNSAATSTCGTSATRPAWLPAGATENAPPPPPPTTSSMPVTQIAQSSEFSLPGRVNANTVPAGGMTMDNWRSAHNATTVQSVFAAGLTALPGGGDPRFSKITTFSVGCSTGQLTVQPNGYGAARAEWIDPAGYHLLLTDRAVTEDGRSGPSDADLEHMATSFYTGS